MNAAPDRRPEDHDVPWFFPLHTQSWALNGEIMGVSWVRIAPCWGSYGSIRVVTVALSVVDSVPCGSNPVGNRWLDRSRRLSGRLGRCSGGRAAQATRRRADPYCPPDTRRVDRYPTVVPRTGDDYGIVWLFTWDERASCGDKPCLIGVDTGVMLGFSSAPGCLQLSSAGCSAVSPAERSLRVRSLCVRSGVCCRCPVVGVWLVGSRLHRGFGRWCAPAAKVAWRSGSSDDHVGFAL